MKLGLSPFYRWRNWSLEKLPKVVISFLIFSSGGEFQTFSSFDHDLEKQNVLQAHLFIKTLWRSSRAIQEHSPS